MQSLWAVLCRSCSVDQTSNALSVFEIVEEIQVIEPDAAAIPDGALIERELSLVAMFGRSGDAPEKGELRLRLVTPKKETPMGAMVVDLENHKRYRLIARLPGIPFFGSGVYWFCMDDGQGRELVRYGVDLTVSPAAR